MTLNEYFAGGRGRVAQMREATTLAPSYLSQIAKGRKPLPMRHAAAIERASGLRVRRWDMFPHDWHRIWPELIGTEGAPAVPADQAAHHPQEASHAA